MITLRKDSRNQAAGKISAQNWFGKVGTGLVGWWYFSIFNSVLGLLSRTQHFQHTEREDYGYLLGVVVSALADNGSSVKMILQKDEQQTEHDNESGGLERRK